MHFNDLRKAIRPILDSRVSLELVSAPGRGKSTFIDDTVEAQSVKDGKKWGISKLFLATQTPPDLMGYVFKGERVFNGKPTAISEPTLPGWMITQEGNPVYEYERGVLFLDEYGQGESDVKRASAELLLNRQLGPWRLPDGWSVVAASNRATDRSGVTKSFDFVINRRMEIHIDDDLASWERWAVENGVHPTFIAFGVQYPQVLLTPDIPEKQGPWCTPRSLVMAASVLSGMADAKGVIPVDATASEMASGLIGQAATAQLIAMIRLGNEMPKFEDIVAGPEKCHVPEKPDAQMLIAYNLAARVEEKNADPIMTYLQRFPKEFAVTFAKSACRRMPSLINTRSFERWCTENMSLVSAIIDVAA